MRASQLHAHGSHNTTLGAMPRHMHHTWYHVSSGVRRRPNLGACKTTGNGCLPAHHPHLRMPFCFQGLRPSTGVCDVQRTPLGPPSCTPNAVQQQLQTPLHLRYNYNTLQTQATPPSGDKSVCSCCIPGPVVDPCGCSQQVLPAR